MATFSVCNSCAEKDRKKKQHKIRSANTKNIQSLASDDDTSKIMSKDNEDSLLYNVCDLEELVSINFRNSEEKDNYVEFSVMVELEKELFYEEILSSE
ncbi:10812_t:CDS:1, partial [Ambispora gerdemannii]